MASTDTAYVMQSATGEGYVSSNGMLFPIGRTPTGQRYVVKDGLMYVLPDDQRQLVNGLLFSTAPGNQVVVGPSGQALPPGVPSGTVTQSGSSVSPTFAIVAVGGVLALIGLGWYLTRH